MTDPTYGAIHLRLNREAGAARHHMCECGQPAEQWAYQHTGDPELVDEQGRHYSADLDDYEAMCRSCHNKFDIAHGQRGPSFEKYQAKAHSPEAVAKMRAGLTGRVRTPEQRENMRQGALRRWARERGLETP